MRVVVAGLFILASMPSFATHDERDEIEQRIRPVGHVHVEQSATPTAASIPEASTVKKKSGQAIYEQYCIVCHRDGVANAPKFRDSADWKPRLVKKIDALVSSAIKGLNAMPAKGTCQECSDADIKAAVEYMVPSP